MTTAQRRVAVVTGAGTGIGRAASIALAGAGYTLVLAGRREEPLHETGAMLGGADYLAVSTDVAQPDSVAALFEAVRAAYGRVDVLFNNAGLAAPPGHFEDTAFEDWKRVVDVNLNGAFLCSQAAIRLMQAQSPAGGRIINNGSIAAYAPRPNGAAYAATKSAITGLTKALALDGRRMGIACGQIDIGNAATEMTEPMRSGVLQADGSVRAEPSMDVEDVGRAVAYMASLPLESNVLFMTVMATNMPYVGRG